MLEGCNTLRFFFQTEGCRPFVRRLVCLRGTLVRCHDFNSSIGSTDLELM